MSGRCRWASASTPTSRPASSASAAATCFVDGAVTLTRPLSTAASPPASACGAAPSRALSRRCRPAGDDEGPQQYARSISTIASGSPAMPSRARARRSRSPGTSKPLPPARLATAAPLRLVLWPAMDIYLPIAGLSVNALFIVALGLPGRRAVGHVRGRRRLPHHPAADLLRHPADRRGGLGGDPDHRRQRVGRDGPHAPRRRRPRRWRR